MQRMHYLIGSGLLILALCWSQPAQAWGFWAHQRINRLAVFTLPPEMLYFYKAYIEYLTEHAVDPDKRRYAVDGEAARHYIDVDHYDVWPFPEVPRTWDEAVAKYSEDTLQAYGIVPWHLPRGLYRLQKAFETGDLAGILRHSADLGHYVADAHVPLHTTENYNGQFTGQKGIHGFWESRLPELFAEQQYDFFVGRAFYIDDLLDESWATVLESHRALDSVLRIERELSAAWPEDQKYGYENRGRVVMRVYSRPYATAYHERLGGMVERRMRASIRRTGAYWYTAWKRAGSPDLTPLVDRAFEVPPVEYERRLQLIDRESSEIGAVRQALDGRYAVQIPYRPPARMMGMWRAPAEAPVPVAQPVRPSWWQALWAWVGQAV